MSTFPAFPSLATRAGKITLAVRACLVVLTLSVCVLVFGPFSGGEARFGLTDKEAHSLAFFTLTAFGLAALPRVRKWDVALMALALGGLIEVIQPFVGRNGSIVDWMADSLGVALCIAPLVVQDLRIRMRQPHDLQTSQRRASDQTGSLLPGLANEA